MRSERENPKRHFPVRDYVSYGRLFSDVAIFSLSTLATDRGFKERVREDMLVRLLDAFVWRNYGRSHCDPLYPALTTL